MSAIPNHLFLDMKWINRDVNRAEQASIQRFSKVDDIGTFLRHFELFFNNALVDMIVGYTNLYGHRKEAGTSFEITKEMFDLSWICYCLAGVISFQTVKCIRRQHLILLYKQYGV